ncbi:unnamed protein product [Caenorhabditis nigoni]
MLGQPYQTMTLTKNKLLILIWFWSLLCGALTDYITFWTSVQQGFWETLPSFIAIGLWIAIPMLLIVDHCVTYVFRIMTTFGVLCMFLSLFFVLRLTETRDWELIVLYLFFLFSK